MNTPASVLKLLNKSRVTDTVFSWNLLIKHYAKLGEFENAEKVYQQVFRQTFRG
jgi:pentatricopeptide repeat protein